MGPDEPETQLVKLLLDRFIEGFFQDFGVAPPPSATAFLSALLERIALDGGVAS